MINNVKVLVKNNVIHVQVLASQMIKNVLLHAMVK
jgi:hypothetical protein